LNSLTFYLAAPLLLAAAVTIGFLARSASRYRLAHSNEALVIASILQCHPECVALTDTSGLIQSTSDVFDRKFKRADTVGKGPISIVDIVSESGRYQYAHILEYVCRERKPIIKFMMPLKPGELDSDLTVTVIPIWGGHCRILGLIHVFGHTSERERLDPDLGHIEKLTNVGQIAAGLAHELNTPLGSIILSADIIRDTSQPPLVAEEVDKIKSQAEYCSRVVKKLLGYVRKSDDLKTQLDVGAIIEKVSDLVETESRMRRILINIDVAPGEHTILCNENQMEQLFFNLFSNAFHAIDNNGHIHIRVSRDALLSKVMVIFGDDGRGIPEENIEKIFVPFFTTKPHAQGTGLGLALCKRIVLDHGGAIDVASTVGKGTKFTLCFPAVS
jgi:nitrogen-specific signal transduction histidine kinase